MLGFRGKTMNTYHVYWTFSEYADNGYILHTVLGKRDYPDWNFVTTVELPEIDTSKVAEAAVTALDNEITDLRVKIERVEEKKKQLLALSHGGV